MVGVASGALSAAEADGILGDFVHSAQAEHRDRKLQRGTRIGCLPVIVLNRLDPRIDRVRNETEPLPDLNTGGNPLVSGEPAQHLFVGDRGTGRAREREDFDVAEAGFPTSDGEIAAGVVEGITVLNQHVERRHQTECVLSAGTVMFSWNLAGIGQLSDSRITLTFPGSTVASGPTSDGAAFDRIAACHNICRRK